MTTDTSHDDDTADVNNMQQLIQLRWIAVMGQVVTISLVHYGLDIQLPIDKMLGALAFLLAFNAISLLRWRRREVQVTDLELFIALLVDVATFTVQIYLSGGATNPFIFLYLLQVTLGAVLLRPVTLWALVAIATVCFTALTQFNQPLAVPLTHDRGLASPYILGLVLCFVLNAALLVTFITRIQRNLRARDARLADLRQRAAEEDHIVRMGLLASGAAHELGTPLSTLAVILGDWHHLPHFTSDPELLHDVMEMQAQVARCKAIVSGILLSAGEARGDAPVETTVADFLGELVDEWRATRSASALTYDNQFGADLAIVSDSALKQMICNVLDNALEASPGSVSLQVTREDEDLVLTVKDDGPGFIAPMLEHLGKPYQSSKGRPGGGLGLFLVVNVARQLGGTVAASNRVEGGAQVTMRLPLAAIKLDAEPQAENEHHGNA